MKSSILGGRSLFITGTDKKGKSVTRQGKAVRATDFLFSSDRISDYLPLRRYCSSGSDCMRCNSSATICRTSARIRL